MNTLIVLGIIAFGLGMIVFAAAGVLIVVKMTADAKVVSLATNQEPQTPSGPAQRATPPPAPVAPGPPPSATLGTDDLASGLDQEDEFQEISTGVLNLSDFQDLDAMIEEANKRLDSDN